MCDMKKYLLISFFEIVIIEKTYLYIIVVIKSIISTKWIPYIFIISYYIKYVPEKIFFSKTLIGFIKFWKITMDSISKNKKTSTEIVDC